MVPESEANVNGKHRSVSRNEHLADGEITNNEAERPRQDDGALSRGDIIPQSISITNSPLLSIMRPTTPITPPEGSLVDNSSRKSLPMDPEVFEASPGHGDVVENESIRSYQQPMLPISPSHMIITYDFVERMDEDKMSLLALEDQSSGDRYSDEEFQIKSLFDRRQRRWARQRKREAKLPHLRSRNLQTRARTSEKRRELGGVRLEISIADREFMKLVREGVVGQGLDDQTRFQDQLKHAHKRLQDARNLYGPLEETYDEVEETLDRQDFELERLEEKVLKPRSQLEDGDDDSDTTSTSSDGDRSGVSDINESPHPLYGQYLSRLGDKGLLEEEYADLLSEYKRLREQKALRQGVQIDLHPDDQEILANFPTEEAKLLADIREVATDVERLLNQCKTAGVLPEDDYGGRSCSDASHLKEQMPNIPVQPNDFIDIGKVSAAQSEYNRFPLLLESPVEKPIESPDLSDLSKSNVLLSDFEENNPGDRITCWLLHKLRSSCSEVELLARFSPTMDGLVLDFNKDTENWQNQVLHLWFVDSANLPPSVYKVQTKSDGLEITGAVAITLIENEAHFQPPHHPASPPAHTPPNLSPSAVPLLGSPLLAISPNPLSSNGSPSNPPSPLSVFHSSSWKLEGIIEIYSQPLSKPITHEGRISSRQYNPPNPELAKYTIDNTTSQRIQIRTRTSNYASFLLSEKTLPNRWSLDLGLDISGLDLGKGGATSFKDRDARKRKFNFSTGRRAMSMGPWLESYKPAEI